MSGFVRSGYPQVINSIAAASTPVYISFRGQTGYLRIASPSAIKVFFYKADAGANVNYVTIAAGGVWEGPADCSEIWISGSGTPEIVAFVRP